MRKNRREEKQENLDRWLLTYADMITLLMAFFIMMYSMSVLNLSKFRAAAISIRSGFNGIMKGQGKSVMGSSGMFAPRSSTIEGDAAGVKWQVIKPLVDYIEANEKEKGASIGEDARGIVITLVSDNVIFEPGSAKLRPESYPMLDRVAELIDKVENRVQVEGHTCDLNPRNSKYPTNWELSTARSTTVLRYLVEEKGLPADRFSAAGYGSVRPIMPNNSDSNRCRNRRVEIILVRPEPVQSEPRNYVPEEIRRID